MGAAGVLRRRDPWPDQCIESCPVCRQKFIPFVLPKAIAWPPVLGGMAVGLWRLPSSSRFQPLLRFRRVRRSSLCCASVVENAAPVRRDFVAVGLSIS
jgi:hypothetical protein